MDLETLEIHRLKADLILFHKLVTQNVKLDSSILIFSNTHVTRTNPQGIVSVIAHKNASINFFFSRVSKLYLKLPSHYVLLPLSQFIDCIKKFDLSYYDLNAAL